MSDWINTDKELPKCDGFYETKSAYYDEGHIMEFNKCSSHWFNDPTSVTSSVTHWRLIKTEVSGND